ncbi:zinc finger, CCHC-type containing protein [Tanacetum coccineum]
MEDEILNFIPNKELDKEILIPIPRESKIGKDCDFPLGDDFQSFKTFSNPLFEKQDDFPSRNDESIFKEEVHKETLKSHLNPLFKDDEEIISNEVSRQISPKVDVKTIVSFFSQIGNCVRKWATSEFVKDNDEFNHEVFKSDNENDLGVHDNEEEEIVFLDGLLEDENFFEINDKKVEFLERKTKEDSETKVEPEKKKELQVFHPDIEILNHFETTSYVGSDYVFYEDFSLVDIIFPVNIQGKVFDPGISHFEKDAFKDKSSKELAPSKALLTLDVFDPLHPPLMDFHVTKAFSGFTFSLLKIFSKKFFEPGIKNATVDGTIKKFKARLVIHGFKQKSGIDEFDTYAPVARISTIRLLIAMASIHNLIIHHMDVKTTFFNDDLDEEVDPTKEFLSLKFYIKDMGEANVILGIRIKHESNEISVFQSHYIEKVLKKFNYFDCTPVGTPMDTSEKLMPNNVGKVSKYTSNPSTQHWQAIQRVLKYLKKIMVYRLTYTGYSSALEEYIDASWISNTEDNSSTSGWVFLLGGGAISWASKKQTCITGSTMEFEFVALATASKEAKWLKNFLLEISLWSKPIAPIYIRCDNVATLAMAYSKMYNGKSRHLGIRHSMIRELITNEVVSIKFVRSQQNLADHLMKGLARDLVIKSAKKMGLKSN